MDFKIDQQNHGCKKMTLKLFPKKIKENHILLNNLL